MRERPILFTAPMVRAILDDRKTMTRRAVKPQPTLDHGLVFEGFALGKFGAVSDSVIACPCGTIGDRLWLREAWAGGVDFGTVIYKADGTELPPYNGARWYPSIHMFRRDSRITLEITNVRVERLQEITEEDAIREGVVYDEINQITAVKNFMNLWEQIYGNKYPWSSNPWVWVIEFRKVK